MATKEEEKERVAGKVVVGIAAGDGTKPLAGDN
jgi:hypothetical protein